MPSRSKEAICTEGPGGVDLAGPVYEDFAF